MHFAKRNILAQCSRRALVKTSPGHFYFLEGDKFFFVKLMAQYFLASYRKALRMLRNELLHEFCSYVTYLSHYRIGKNRIICLRFFGNLELGARNWELYSPHFVRWSRKRT